MQIINEKLDIDETLDKKIKNILKFLNIKEKIQKGNIINISKTSLAYIEPHKLVINNITYLFFNECKNVYINTSTANGRFFVRMLQLGNEKAKEATINEIKDYYDNEDFDKDDIYDIAKDTNKEEELFDYADINNYYAKDDDFDLEMYKTW